MKKSAFRILNPAEPVGARGLSRRRMMQRLLGAGGTGWALPGIAAAHPVARHMMSGGTMAAAQAKAADPGWEPIFFDPHQIETLIVMAERIVPNSTQAQVNRFIDTLISVDTQENQKKFLASLSAFDHEAIIHYNRPFKDVSEEQQNAILTEASTAEPSARSRGAQEAAARRPQGWECAARPHPAGSFREHQGLGERSLLLFRSRHEGAWLDRPGCLGKPPRLPWQPRVGPDPIELLKTSELDFPHVLPYLQEKQDR